MPAARTAARIGSILAAILVLGWLYFGLRLESWINLVDPVRLPEVSPRAEALHATSFVADLHADSLLFGRDLLERSDMGHVDLPRLQEGGGYVKGACSQGGGHLGMVSRWRILRTFVPICRSVGNRPPL